MERTGRGVDFVTVDGGEGGTGAAPLVFSDHVALPFKWAFARVYRAFAEEGLHHDVVFIGSAKLGIPENALLALALGCDMINVARTPCSPSGASRPSAATPAAARPASPRSRVAAARPRPRVEVGALRQLSGHPALRAAVPGPRLRRGPPRARAACGIELLDVDLRTVQVDELFDYKLDWGLPGPADVEAITTLMVPDGLSRPST